MARLKFVSAKEPADHALKLFKVQQKAAKLRKELAILDAQEKSLVRYLVKVGKGQSFAFDGPKYQMVTKISEHSRMILDQEACKRLLKGKTPYCESTWTTVKIDYLYED